MAMGRVCIVGATGATGRRVAAQAVAQGLEVVLAGRHRPRLEALAAEIGGGEVRGADLSQPSTLDGLLDGVAVVAACAGPFTEVGRAVAEAAVRAGVHYVDTTGEPRFCQALVEGLDRPARQAGVALVTACGASSVPADLAAVTALTAAGPGGADQVTVAYRIAGMRPTAGTVRSSIHITAGGALSWDGRRLVPRPAGGGLRTLPSGAGVRFACPDPVVISRYCEVPVDAFVVVPGAAIVGRFMTMAQRALSAPGRTGHLGRLAGHLPDTDDGRPHGRFAVEASAWGRAGAASTVAAGTDVYGFTARAVVLVAAALSGYEGEGGVRAPSQVVDGVEKAAVELGLGLSTRTIRPGEPVSAGRRT